MRSMSEFDRGRSYMLYQLDKIMDKQDDLKIVVGLWRLIRDTRVELKETVRDGQQLRV